MKSLFFLLLLWTTYAQANSVNKNELNFVVLSDIHIYTSGKIPAKAKSVIKHIINLKPDLVFITGDHTNGNRNDGHELPKVSTWYESLNLLLTPLVERNIPIFPTVGNHDYYEPAHKTAYDTWAKQVISRSINLLKLEQPNDYLSFPFKLKNTEFFVLNLWRQSLGSEQTSWIKSYNSSNEKKGLRFAFGHVPLRSTIGRTSAHFYKTTSNIFNQLELDAYICGHEHLHWDEINPQTNSFRQIIVGTASGTYNFPIRRQMAEIHCGNQTCLMPATKRIFKVKKLSNGAAEQIYKQNWLHVKVNGTEYTTDSYALDSNDDAIDFYLD